MSVYRDIYHIVIKMVFISSSHMSTAAVVKSGELCVHTFHLSTPVMYFVGWFLAHIHAFNLVGL